MSDRPAASGLWNYCCAISLAIAAFLVFSAPAEAQMNRPFHKDGWILTAGHTPGMNNSNWRTDLWIATYENSTSAKVTLYFCKADTDNTGITGYDLPLTGATRTTYIEGVVDQFLHIGTGRWLGAIHYVANANVQVWARVYSVSPDGRESFGQGVEGIPSADKSPDSEPWDSDDHQWLWAMKRTADGRFRVNVGVVNPTGVAASFSINIYTSAGERPSSGTTSKTVQVPPFSMTQLTDPFATTSGGEWNSHTIRIVCNTEGGGTFAYASVIDNATNDPVFVRGVKRKVVGSTD